MAEKVGGRSEREEIPHVTENHSLQRSIQKGTDGRSPSLESDWIIQD